MTIGWHKVSVVSPFMATLLALSALGCSSPKLMACGKVIANEVISVKSLDISPDGRYLAVIHSSTYSLHLKVVDLETGGMIVDDDDFHHTLPAASQPIRAVRWLDNGGRLLYSDGRDIRELELGSSRVTVMA